MVLEEQRHHILEVANRYGLTDVRLFGSVARGDADEDSDIDFLVRLQPGSSPLGLGGFLIEMRELFGRRVDVATEAMLSRDTAIRSCARLFAFEIAHRAPPRHPRSHFTNSRKDARKSKRF